MSQVYCYQYEASIGARTERVLSALRCLPESWAIERMRVELPYLLGLLSRQPIQSHPDALAEAMQNPGVAEYEAMLRTVQQPSEPRKCSSCGTDLDAMCLECQEVELAAAFAAVDAERKRVTVAIGKVTYHERPPLAFPDDGPSEPHPDAEAVRDWLFSHDIPAGSTTVWTEHDARMAAKALEMLGGE